MAQSYFYPCQPATGTGKNGQPKLLEKRIPFSPKFRDLELRILTHDTDTDTDIPAFIVYTTHITNPFLQKFHNPYKAPPGDDRAAVSGFKIEYTKVPIWPILGLRERLGKAFGQDVVGFFNPNEMETWVTDLEEPENGQRKARGR
ncbi:hypothetical protein FALCPG4_015737 [Fusarium falciforme]